MTIPANFVEIDLGNTTMKNYVHVDSVGNFLAIHQYVKIGVAEQKNGNTEKVLKIMKKIKSLKAKNKRNNWYLHCETI